MTLKIFPNLHHKSAKKILNDASIKFIYFFSFYKYSTLNLGDVRFWSDFTKEFDSNRKQYELIYSRLNNKESRDIFTGIINFRLSTDLTYMAIFSDKEKFQYFKPFLGLNKNNKVFVDVGRYG